MDISQIKELGIAGLIFVPFFFLLKWVLEEMKKVLEREATERNKWLEVIQNSQNSLNEHTSQAKAFHDQVNEAHRYQREEHQKMIEALGRINDYQDEKET